MWRAKAGKGVTRQYPLQLLPQKGDGKLTNETIIRQFDQLTLSVEKSGTWLSSEAQELGDREERGRLVVDGAVSTEQLDEALLDKRLVHSVLAIVLRRVVKGVVRDGIGHV